MKTIFKGSIAAAALLALGAVSLPASARWMPASIGRASDPKLASFFLESLGSLTNISNTLPNTTAASAFLVLPLVIEDGTITVSPKVGTFSPDVNHVVSCATRAASADGLTYNGGGLINSPTVGVASVISAGTAVLTGGAVVVDCLVPPTARVNYFAY